MSYKINSFNKDINPEILSNMKSSLNDSLRQEPHIDSFTGYGTALQTQADEIERLQQEYRKVQPKGIQLDDFESWNRNSPSMQIDEIAKTQRRQKGLEEELNATPLQQNEIDPKKKY
jgi:hypothetical protein